MALAGMADYGSSSEDEAKMEEGIVEVMSSLCAGTNRSTYYADTRAEKASVDRSIDRSTSTTAASSRQAEAEAEADDAAPVGRRALRQHRRPGLLWRGGRRQAAGGGDHSVAAHATGAAAAASAEEEAGDGRGAQGGGGACVDMSMSIWSAGSRIPRSITC